MLIALGGLVKMPRRNLPTTTSAGQRDGEPEASLRDDGGKKEYNGDGAAMTTTIMPITRDQVQLHLFWKTRTRFQIPSS